MLQGTLKKMAATLSSPVEYTLVIGEELLPLNQYLGQPLELNYSGQIFCDNCGRKTNKSFAQGHCYPCMQRLARCDMCVLKPETCHFAAGTCREPEWGETHCMINHVVYLANTSAMKVGITRHSQVPTRWIDQGATQALPIIGTRTRHIAGLVEVAIAKSVADKTNWRAILKGDGAPLDLADAAQDVIANVTASLEQIQDEHGDDAFMRLEPAAVSINYPVLHYPEKIKSHNFDKNPVVHGTLEGIKGQYLIFDSGVINVRKFTGYEVSVTAG